LEYPPQGVNHGEDGERCGKGGAPAGGAGGLFLMVGLRGRGKRRRRGGEGVMVDPGYTSGGGGGAVRG